MLELLRRQGFVEMPGAKVASAVYLLLHFGTVVYVGKSRNIHARVGNHLRDRGKVRPAIYYQTRIEALGIKLEFDQILVKFAKVGDLDRLERELIRFYSPRYNIQTPSPLPDVKIDVLALAREVGVQWKQQEQQEQKGLYRRRVA